MLLYNFYVDNNQINQQVTISLFTDVLFLFCLLTEWDLVFRWPTSGGATSRTRSVCLSVSLFVCGHLTWTHNILVPPWWNWPKLSGQIRSGLARSASVQVRPGQVRSGQVRSGQVRSGQVRSGQVRSGQVRSGQVRSGQARSGQVRRGQVRSGQARSGQDHWTTGPLDH